jgi:hypothetical protein
MKSSAPRSGELIFRLLIVPVCRFFRGLLRSLLHFYQLAVAHGIAPDGFLFRPLLGPGQMPIAQAVAPSESESEANRHPLLRRTEAEGGG